MFTSKTKTSARDIFVVRCQYLKVSNIQHIFTFIFVHIHIRSIYSRYSTDIPSNVNREVNPI